MYNFLYQNQNVLILSIYIIHKIELKHLGPEVLVVYEVLGYFELYQVFMYYIVLDSS